MIYGRHVPDPVPSILCDKTPLPPQAATPEDDDKLFEDDPWIEPPVNMDYGYNVKLGDNVYVNFNATFLDTCTISLGSRTLVGPNVSFFSLMDNNPFSFIWFSLQRIKCASHSRCPG